MLPEGMPLAELVSASMRFRNKFGMTQTKKPERNASSGLFYIETIGVPNYLFTTVF